MFITTSETEAVRRTAEIIHRLRPMETAKHYQEMIEGWMIDLSDQPFGSYITSAGVVVTRYKYKDEPTENGYFVSLKIAEITDDDLQHFVFDPADSVGTMANSEKFPVDLS